MPRISTCFQEHLWISFYTTKYAGDNISNQISRKPRSFQCKFEKLMFCWEELAFSHVADVQQPSHFFLHFLTYISDQRGQGCSAGALSLIPQYILFGFSFSLPCYCVHLEGNSYFLDGTEKKALPLTETYRPFE